MTVRLAIVVAQGRNRVIGADGALPWRQSTDMKRFKAITMGKPVIMGRKTWQSLPNALTGRPNLVVTRDPSLRAEGATIWSSLSVALAGATAMAKAAGLLEVCVIGGSQIYAEALPRVDRLYLTEIDAAPPGDAFFPEIDPQHWHEVSSERFAAGPKDDHAGVMRVLDRI